LTVPATSIIYIWACFTNQVQNDMEANVKPTFQEIIQSEKPVLVDFYATWCGPCKAMNPVIKSIAADLRDRAKVIKVDVDQNRALAEKYQIRGVPTFMVFKEGQIHYQKAGTASKGQLLDAVAAAEKA
ncbi:MAG: thioredoxin, partial [Bacteroidota bacterium]